MSSDRRKESITNKITPIPTSDIDVISKNLQKTASAVTIMGANIDVIKNDILPPMAKTTQETKEGLLRLEGRVNSIENKGHYCLESEKHNKHENKLSSISTQQKNTSKLLWSFIGVFSIICSAVFSFAFMTQSVSAKNSTEINNNYKNIKRNELDIKSLEKSQNRNNKIWNNNGDSTLTKGEREMILMILNSEKKRSSE